MAKFIRRAVGLVTLGYVAGVLTAPRSGKQTRKKIKHAATKSSSEVEAELKHLYKQLQEAINKFSKDNPKLDDKLRSAKKSAEVSQAKLKNLISAFKGQDDIDEDLSSAIDDAKKSISALFKYVKKS